MEGSHRCETEAFVTLATNDQYAYGALTLGQSLRNVGTSRQLAIMITTHVTQRMRQQLTKVFDRIQQVDPLDSHDTAHLALLARPELGITFSKLHCWSLTQYTKCVFLDADCLILQNVDDLFEREEFSAAPDVGWPDCFNSGVFVFRPSDETHRGLLQCAITKGSFDGGDQGLLNTYFSDWSTKDISRHLPFIYNMTSSVGYSYQPAYKQFGKDVRIVHFIGVAKPWLYTYNVHSSSLQPPEGSTGQHDIQYVNDWWKIFSSHIKPRIEHDQGIELTNQLGDLRLDKSTVSSTRSESPRSGQRAWERGEIDYLGADRFNIIQDQIQSVLDGKEVEVEEEKVSTAKEDSNETN